MKLKTLIFDVETAPIIAQVWGLKDQNIGLNQIVSDWSIMAFAAKWLDDPASSVLYVDTYKKDEIYLLKQIWKLLDEADVVITQNGERFDGPKLNARFIHHGMPPPSPYRHLDTYKIAKRVFGFTSNKLEYLTDKLCVKYKKLSHKKFPGMSLWTECLKGNKKAWDEMRTYNVHDVLATEELYMKLRAWAPGSMASPHFFGTSEESCRVCGSADLQKRGTNKAKTGEYQRYQCQTCQSWQQGAKLK